MTYDFTSFVDRKGTSAHKWEQMYAWNDNVEEGILPLSVADMEIKSAPEIYEGLITYLKSDPILGYTGATEGYLEAVVDWQSRRHNWQIEKDWIVSTPGVVAAIHAAIRTFSKPGEGVILFKPVYYPFMATIEENNRTEVNVPLLENDGEYTIDFDAFETEAEKDENKILLFCSPHNPVGRVWTEEELSKLADIAVKHDLFVIADEIWNDLVQPEKEHTVLHTVNEDLEDQIMTCTSASKSFNLAGISTSNIILSDKEIREAFADELMRSHLASINVFGYEATRIAYTEAEDWLDELNELVHRNQTVVQNFFNGHYPDVKAPVSEGTYVQWLDFRALDMSDEALDDFLHNHQFFPNPGHVFGEEGSGYARINTALPTANLKKALNHLLKGLNELD